MRTAVFESFDGSRSRWQASFDAPRFVQAAHTYAEVMTALRLVEEEAKKGRWAAVMLAYESAPAFDRVLKVHRAEDFPLGWVAIFDKPSTAASRPAAAYKVTPWEAKVSLESYVTAIDKIREYIASGDTYQVNYTFPLACKFDGDAWSWYCDLGAAQGARYCAYLDLGRYQILSLSPELFFERRGDKLITRPMKGTMPRGRWAEEDDAQVAKLAASPKDRAENVMIVDLLRNDLGKISVPGSVRATRLFDIERYRTILQMTSTIESTCEPGVTLADIMQALFPCGSITGAPKIRTMEIINEMEPYARKVYTGAIGLVQPGGDSIFNVAIRTLVLDNHTREATFGVGGGITYDSTARAEYEECLLKARFLNQRWPEFQLLETILLEEGEFFLLERHIERLKAAARYFNFLCNEGEVRLALDRVRITHVDDCWRVRLLVAENGSITVDTSKLEKSDKKIWRVRFATEPLDTNNPFIHHKTTNREVYKQASQEIHNCDDLIFWNQDGEVTESSIANIVFVAEGKKWTPPRSCGLLKGTLRDELLSTGELQERVIHKDDLRRVESLFLINSVRKCMSAILVD
jgi:para-aminobenzoate synthetase/4-amino-4-deoxychorismate lyase